MASGWGRLIHHAGLVIFEAGGFNRRKLSPPMSMIILNPQDFFVSLAYLVIFFYRDSLLQFPISIPEHVIVESPMVFGGRSVLCDEAISNSAGREKRSLLDPRLESSKRESISNSGGFNRRKLSPPMLMIIPNPWDFLRVLCVLGDIFLPG
jgi:hypothetical protein